MKRILVGLTVGFLIAAATPAFAQTGITARVTSPGDGQTLVGSAGVTAEASASAGVRSISLLIDDAVVASTEPSNLRQNVSVGYTWSTGGLRNGWYQIRVEATANGGATDRKFINVKVDNAPSTPTGFNHVVRGQTVSLSWAANPEPDITGYRLEVGSGGTWSVVKETTSTNYAAEVAPGTYQYRVTALRSSPTIAGGRPSDPTAPIALTVEAPPAAEAGGGGGGGYTGGGRGGVGGGDPRVFGRDGSATARDVRSTARSFASGGISTGGISLPGQVGLPSLPGDEPFEWGTYKERLPYSIPEGGIPIDSVPPRLAAFSTTTVLPLDALRWVAAGALMIVIAGLLQFLSLRAERNQEPLAGEPATT
jgi:Bacterial Ig domain